MLNQPYCPVCGNPVAVFRAAPRPVYGMRCSLAEAPQSFVFSYHVEPDRIILDSSLAKDFDPLS
jgi:hypothetical protein